MFTYVEPLWSSRSLGLLFFRLPIFRPIGKGDGPRGKRLGVDWGGPEDSSECDRGGATLLCQNIIDRNNCHMVLSAKYCYRSLSRRRVMIMRSQVAVLLSIAILLLSTSAALAVDICAGKKAGSVTFYDAEISRDTKLPPAVENFKASDSMFLLMCLGQAVGPQASGGKKFRIDLYVDGSQTALVRPQLSKPRKEIIIDIKDPFRDEIASLSQGTHELRFQAVTETETGKREIEVNLDTGSVTKQNLRKAGYVADGKIKITK